MADDKTPPVRRVGAKDRKQRLDPPAPLIPAEDPADLPDDLASLAAEVVPLEPLPPPPTREKADTAERFPPVRDTYDAADDAATTSQSATPATGQRGGNWLHNLIAFIFLLATVALCGYYVTLWNNPYSALNPLSPATPFIIVSETPDFVAIATYEANLTQVASQPTMVPTVIASPTPVEIAATPTPDTQPEPVQPQTVFTLVDEGVQYRENNNGRGCNYASIAGSVETSTGRGLDGYLLQVIDVEEPDLFTVEFLSGSAVGRGPGGFEQRLGNSPRERGYTIQVFDSDRTPLSEPFLIFTRDSCDENVAYVKFVQVGS